MTEPTLNVDLLRRTLDYIEDHPHEWNQEVWRCGTAYCFAGTAVRLDGGTWIEATTGGSLVAARDDDPTDDICTLYPDSVDTVRVDDRAQRILGLTYAQATDLFDSDNSLEDLREQVEALTGGAS